MLLWWAWTCVTIGSSIIEISEISWFSSIEITVEGILNTAQCLQALSPVPHGVTSSSIMIAKLVVALEAFSQEY